MDLSYLDYKHGLVLLIPGEKRFLKRKVVRGNHYFDSVSDVLHIVASYPRLLDIETDESDKKSSSEKECDSDEHSQLNQNDPPDRLQRRYLRPRFPNCNAELMKFTVIDNLIFHPVEDLMGDGGHVDFIKILESMDA